MATHVNHLEYGLGLEIHVFALKLRPNFIDRMREKAVELMLRPVLVGSNALQGRRARPRSASHRTRAAAQSFLSTHSNEVLERPFPHVALTALR